MKTAQDPRHQTRRTAVKQLFARDFTDQEIKSTLAKKVWRRRAQLDKKVAAAAPSWPIKKLNKIDLSILRLAVYELESKTAPAKVIIDEAVELAKEFGAESSPSFVNGVLGTILTNDKQKD